MQTIYRHILTISTSKFWLSIFHLRCCLMIIQISYFYCKKYKTNNIILTRNIHQTQNKHYKSLSNEALKICHIHPAQYTQICTLCILIHPPAITSMQVDRFECGGACHRCWFNCANNGLRGFCELFMSFLLDFDNQDKSKA